MKHKGLRLGYSVHMTKGETWQPTKVEFWGNTPPANAPPTGTPLKYMADALIGISMIKLNHFIKSPIATPELDYSFATEAWHALDPHSELYERSSPRVRALQSHVPVVAPKLCQEFEEHFNEHFEMAIKPWGVDLTALWPLLDTLSWFEKKSGQPLMYNFGLNFSKGFTDKLKYLFSFLYHIRSLVAVDHNGYCEDPSQEGIKMDAITDYLPRAEYVVNDALLYWTFKKSSVPFAQNGQSPSSVSPLFVQPMEKAFQKYSHNACHLINNLPQEFIKSMNPIELEEALYLVQMDWLLGSQAGLLFRIREEIYGLQSGYEKIFWKDVAPKFNAKNFTLNIHCEVAQELVQITIGA